MCECAQKYPVCVCVCAHLCRCECEISPCFTSKTCVFAPAPVPPRAVRISAITRSNSVVDLIDARGLTTSHSRHILTGISYRRGLARALLVPSKENKRRDIRALFQRLGPFCLCLISLWEKWIEGQPISLAPTAEPGASAAKQTVVSCVCSVTLSIPLGPLLYCALFAFRSLIPERLCSFDYGEIRSHNRLRGQRAKQRQKNPEMEMEMERRYEEWFWGEKTWKKRTRVKGRSKHKEDKGRREQQKEVKRIDEVRGKENARKVGKQKGLRAGSLKWRPATSGWFSWGQALWFCTTHTPMHLDRGWQWFQAAVCLAS